MKIRNIFLTSLALLPVLFASSCNKNNDEPSGAPSIEINPSTLEFEMASSSQTFQVVATRSWKVQDAPDWVAFEPKSGKATNGKDVKVTVLENTGLDRTAAIKVTIGFDEKTLTINQKGTGSASGAIVYKNDFDKEVATKTYGSSNESWPYLDQFEGWKNETGSGIANVTYTSNGMSVRANSTSSSNYSDYEGSGSNNMFFGTSSYFSVQNIALSSGVNYTLTFGSERYVQNETNTFNHEEFHVYVSNDAKKWVELEYAFPNGDKDGRWDQASSTFTVPAGTTTLSLYFKSDVGSAYRLDDVVLAETSVSGTAIDFSKGVELEGGSSSGSDDYSKAESKTVAEFIAAANTSTYYKLKGKVSSFNSKYCSFDLTDETGTIYVYSVTDESKTAYVDKIKDGGTVEIAGKYKKYDDKNEAIDAQILSYTEDDTPSTKMTIAQVLAATAGTSVEVEGIVAGAYARGFVITDGTDYLLVYEGTKCSASVKDKVTVTGTTSTFGGLVQVASPTVTVVSSDNELNLPEPKALDATAFDAYSSDKIELITYTGTLAVDGNYTNVTVSGATKYTGSLAYIPASFDASSFDGKVVKVTGFFIGLTSSKYISTMVTELKADETAKYLSVSATSLTAKATDTSASFKVGGNVKWTVASDNADYTVSPASGEGEAEVTVSFAANTSDAAKTVKLTVSTTEDVATKSYEITLVHAGAAAADEVIATAEQDYLKANKSGSVDSVISYENDSDYGTTTVTELRVYKGKNLTIKAAAGYTITKVELTCSGNAGAKQGFYTTSPVTVDDGATSTSSAEGKVGVITVSGNTSSVKYTASENQMRVTKLSVTYKAVK